MHNEKIVIFSCDDSHFVEFLPIVCRAWKKFFPNIKIAAAFVSDGYSIERRRYFMDNTDYFIHLKPHPEVDTAIQGKIARHYMAATMFRENHIIMLNDLDLFPLQETYAKYVFTFAERNNLVVVGENVLCGGEDDGKWPSSYTTASGQTWGEIWLNGGMHDYHSFINRFRSICIYDDHESLSLDYKNFSDESLLRAMCRTWHGWGTRTTHISRYWDTKNDTIDRSCWAINEKKLYAGEYVQAHVDRPLNKEKCKPILRYLDINYD